LSTVARLAGVSVASVSRVLNDLPATPEMESRVREAALQLGYVPDSAARSLRGRRTHQLAFAVPDIGNPTYVAMMHAVEATAREAGYRLVLHSTSNDADQAAQVINDLRRRYVDGLIITSVRFNQAYLKALATASAPVVVAGTLPDGFPVDVVWTDSSVGIELAVAHLVSGGRRHIGMLNGPRDTVPGAMRTEGFLSGLAAAGLSRTSAPVEHAAEFSHGPGRVGAEALLRAHDLDAIVCGNDLLAVAAMRTLHELGRPVPADTAVTGMDDTELAAFSIPSLTSVSLRAAERGAMAARLMLERLADPDLPPRRITVEPRLVVRESSGPPRRAGGPRARDVAGGGAGNEGRPGTKGRQRRPGHVR
jgi:LacI family transcriptional regulator